MIISQSDDRREMKSIIAAVNAIAASIDVRTDRRAAPQTTVAVLGSDRAETRRA
jgi:hypothetical protein